jgi:hypothetical protein
MNLGCTGTFLGNEKTVAQLLPRMKIVSVSAVTRCGVNYFSFGGMSMKTADETKRSSADKF